MSTVVAPLDSGGIVRRPSGEAPPLPKTLNRAAIASLVAFAGWAAIWVWVMVSDAPGAWITERDLDLMGPLIENRQPWLDPVARGLNDVLTHWAPALIIWPAVIVGLAARRIRHVLVLVGSVSVTVAIVTPLAVVIARPRPLGIEMIGDWTGFAQPSRPIALTTAGAVGAVLTVAPAGRWQRCGHVLAAAVLAGLGWAQLYVGVDHPTDVLAGATTGVAVTLTLFRLAAPEAIFPVTYRRGRTAHLDVTGSRGEAIRTALRDQLGVDVTAIEPVGLAGSAGSTPLRVVLASGRDVFAKLYARSHLRSDRFYKLGRTLRYGRLEDEHRFTSIRRIVQHEDYLLHVMARAGVPAPRPHGIVELTPEREYLCVCDFLDGAVELGDTAVTVDLIDQGVEIVHRLWSSGLAHRDIKPSNLMVRDGRLYTIDVAFAQVRPSPWRQAVDLANMLLVLALGSDVETVLARARQRFTDDELAEAFAATGGVTIPGQLRDQLARDGRGLIEEFRRSVPARPPVKIQRWSMRRLALTAWVGVVGTIAAVALIQNLHTIGLAP